MGAANLKGKTFEERKAKAIAEGRIKTGPKKSINRIMREYESEFMADCPFMAAATFINIASGRSKWREK